MPLDPVHITVTIRKDPVATFAAFTDKITQWWPLDTHAIGPTRSEPAPDLVVLEPNEGGRIYEVSTDGQQRLWGRVEIWQPPKMLRLRWHPGRPEAQATQVDVRFDPTDAGHTHVTLVHSGWEALAQDGPDMQANYATGWAMILTNRFAPFAGT